MEIATQQLQYRDLYKYKVRIISTKQVKHTASLFAELLGHAGLPRETLLNQRQYCLTTIASVNHLIPSRTQ